MGPEPLSEWQSGSWHNVDIPIVSEHHRTIGSIPWGNMTRVELFAVRVTTPTALKIKDLRIVAPFATVPTYDCEGEFANWEKAWSQERRKWCCKTNGQACTPSKAQATVAPPTAVVITQPPRPVVTMAPAKPTVAPVQITKAAASPKPVRIVAPTPPKITTTFNYNIQILGPTPTDPPPPHNCWAGYASWETSWTTEKKSWCCQHEAKGCENGGATLSSGAGMSTGTPNTVPIGSSRIIWLIMFFCIGASALYHFGVLSLSGLESCLDNFRSG